MSTQHLKRDLRIRLELKLNLHLFAGGHIRQKGER